MPRKFAIPEGLNLAELVKALCLTVYDYRPYSFGEKVIDAVRDPERTPHIHNPELEQFRYILPNSGPGHYEQSGCKTRAERGYALAKNARMPSETRDGIELNCLKFALKKLGLLEEISQNEGRIKTEYDYASEVAHAVHLPEHTRDLAEAMRSTIDTFIQRANRRTGAAR